MHIHSCGDSTRTCPRRSAKIKIQLTSPFKSHLWDKERQAGPRGIQLAGVYWQLGWMRSPRLGSLRMAAVERQLPPVPRPIPQDLPQPQTQWGKQRVSPALRGHGELCWPRFLSQKMTNSSSTSRRLFIISLPFTSRTQIITYANHLIMTSGFQKWIIYRNVDNIYLFSARTLQNHRNTVRKGTLKGHSRPPALKEMMVEIMCIIMEMTL